MTTTTTDLSRVDEMMKRTRHDDLQELKLDRQAIEELVIEDERRVGDLRQQLEDLTAQLQLAETKLTGNKIRLRAKINAIAELEVHEVGL